MAIISANAVLASTNNTNVVAENKYRKVRNAYPREWNMSDFFSATAKATDIGFSIGVFVNTGMHDMLLSGEHKENMLSCLADIIAEYGSDQYALTHNGRDYTLGQVYDWLRDREDDQLREVNSNLEAFIDYAKMGKGDPLVLQPLLAKVADVRDNSLVYPELFMINNGSDEDAKYRVPAGRQAKQDYVLLPSLVCVELTRIANEIKQLEEALTEEEWFNVDAIPATLDASFPRNRGLRDEAISMRADWREVFANRKGKVSDAYQDALNTVVRPGIYNNELFRLDDTVTLEEVEDLRMHYAVEHARLTYRGRKDKVERNLDGSAKSYPDGLLWTNALGSYYIKALETAGLTGIYVPVMFDRHSTKYSRGSHPVVVESGLVFHSRDKSLLGKTKGDNVESGSFTMQDGMICIQEPAAEMHEDRTQINEDFDNPVNGFDGFNAYENMDDDAFMASL